MLDLTLNLDGTSAVNTVYLRNLARLKSCHLVLMLVLSCGKGGTAGQNSRK